MRDSQQPVWADIAKSEQEIWLDFMGLEYWRRLWIVQEFLLAKNITFLHGTAILSSGVFTSFCQSRFGLQNVIELIKMMVNRRSNTVNPRWLDMFYLYKYTTSSHCLDARDKVFGLQSLLEDQERVPVSYEMSVEDVYVEMEIRLAASSAHLVMWETYSEVLYFVGRGMGLLEFVTLKRFRENMLEGVEVPGGGTEGLRADVVVMSIQHTAALRRCLAIERVSSRSSTVVVEQVN
jgi:hypothetical protein